MGRIGDRVRLAATLAIVGLAAVACGGAVQSSQGPAATGTTKPAGSADTAASQRTDVDDLKVTAKDFAFTLNLTALRPGFPGVDASFSNAGSTAHTLTFYSDPDFKTKIPAAGSGSVAPGASASFPFRVPDGLATVYYRCDIHPTQMKGELPVHSR